jgi:hypothetical protein
MTWIPDFFFVVPLGLVSLHNLSKMKRRSKLDAILPILFNPLLTVAQNKLECLSLKIFSLV